MSQQVSDCRDVPGSAETYNSIPPSPNDAGDILAAAVNATVRAASRAARPTRRGCPNRRRRRTASYGDEDAQPRLPRRLWWRLVRLLAERGQLDPYAQRWARHLTYHADDRGRVRDLEETVIPAYRAHYDLSRRTAYTDLGRLQRAGLIRQARAACPGRPVSYQLCAPQSLPADLPRDLAAELRKLWGVLDDGLDQGDDRAAPVDAAAAVRVRITAVQRHALLAECELTRYGSARSRPRHTTRGCGRLHTWPFLKRVLPHPPDSAGHEPAGPPPPWAVGDITETDATVKRILATCQARWRRARGPGGGVSAAGQARLVPLVRGALLYLASADVIERMTVELDSARDLGAVVATRLRQVIRAGRHARRAAARIRVDEHRHLREMRQAAAQAARRHAETAELRAQARAALEAGRARARQAREARARPGLGVVLPGPGSPPPPPRAAALPVDQAAATADAVPAEELAALRWATINARRAYGYREPAQPPPVAEVLRDRVAGLHKGDGPVL